MAHIISDKPVEPVHRSTRGLRDVLFEQIDRLRTGIATASESNALGSLVRQINGTVDLEMKMVKWSKEMGLGGTKSITFENGATTPIQEEEKK
jgi:hypothetical protein